MMKLHPDIDKYALSVLKKHKQLDLDELVASWLDSEPRSANSLKEMWIFAMMDEDDSFEGADEKFDVSDQSTWPSGDYTDIPSDAFFVDLIKAIRRDIKRAQRRRGDPTPGWMD